MRQESGRHVYALVAILVVGAVVRVAGIGFGLPNTETRPDETVAVSVALHMAKSGLHPHFFDYPTLFPTVLLILYGVYFVVGYGLGWFGSMEDFRALYYTDPSSFYLIARAVSAGCGVATIYLVYAVGRRLYGVAGGVLAAVFLAVCSIHVRDSHFGKVDVPMTCLVALGMVCVLDVYRRGRLRDYLFSGAVMGLAASTKYPAGVFCVGILAAHALRAQGAGRRGWGALLDRPLWAAALATAAAFFIASPYILIDWRGFLGSFPRVSENILGSEEYSRGAYGVGWVYHATFSLRYGLGLGLELLALAGMVWAGWRRRPEELILLSFCVYFLFIGNGRWVFSRYVMPMVPVMLILGAGLAVRVGGLVKGARARALTMCGLAALVLAEPAHGVAHLIRVLSQEDTRLRAAAWIRAHIPDGATVALHGGYSGEPQLPESEEMLRERARGQAGPSRDTYLLEHPVRPRYTLIRVGRSYPADRVLGGWVERDYDLATLRARGVEYVVTQESPLRAYARVEGRMREILGGHATLLAVFDPFTPGTSPRPVYDPIDAFFVPMAGFAGVERPGPKIAIYRLDPLKE